MTTSIARVGRSQKKIIWIAAVAIVVIVSAAVIWRRADQPARAASSPPAEIGRAHV